ncbi:MAG: UDP-N-acetylmuramoyl-tripeptide--D-alanyl-D-alanine ligase [candidate division Zixibacteria bacterium]|nr:UDP-N-acetylmuramoyl-tripeptide--D-alanyl-D-alanine ligase [candidate division Zixibacteria bacterium]
MIRPISLAETADASGGELHIGNMPCSQYAPTSSLRERATETITEISTDSRTTPHGSLFVALAGERFDGHDFVLGALGAGVRAALVNESWFREHAPEFPDKHPFIVVADTLDALQRFAMWHREQVGIPIVAVTGSSGKTTTKEMVAAVLGGRYRVLKTPGNLNSQIGTPQVLLSIRREHEIAVLELGMNHSGEMSRLGRMTRPDTAIITNVGPAHLEYLKTVEGVGDAKGELLHHLAPDGCAILNADDPQVMRQRSRTTARLVTFGRHTAADVRALEVTARIDGSTFRTEDGISFSLRLPGEHQVMNALAAIAAGRLFGVSNDDIRDALSHMTPAPMRMDYRKIGRFYLLMDAYNANPVSTRAALETLALAPGHRIAVLGDMLELGDISASAHRDIGRCAAATADVLVTVGPRAIDIAEGAQDAGFSRDNILSCRSNMEAVALLREIVGPDHYVLVKGSRGMKMEEIATGLEEIEAPSTSQNAYRH